MRGRLGQTDYEIGPDRIVVRRSWRLAILVPLLPLGIVVVAVTIATLEPGPQDPVPIVVAILLATLMLIAGLVGAVSVPWFPPRTITCTARGVQADKIEIPRADVATISIQQIVRRMKGTTAYAYYLLITTTTGHRKRMELTETRSATEPTVILIGEAMNRLVATAPSASVDSHVRAVPWTGP